jgi:hypothetical protein
MRSAADPDAFASLIRRWEQPEQRLCFRMIGNVNRGQDLAQDDFSRWFVHGCDFEPPGKFSTWLWRIAINLCPTQTSAAKPAPQRRRRCHVSRCCSTCRINKDPTFSSVPPTASINLPALIFSAQRPSSIADLRWASDIPLATTRSVPVGSTRDSAASSRTSRPFPTGPGNP